VDTHLLRQVQPKGGSGKLGPFDFRMSIGALPRPVLFGAVGLVLVVVIFLATRKPSDSGSSGSTPAATQTAAPAHSPTTASGSPAPSKAAKPSGSQTGGAGSGLPARVKQALDAHKVVVVLFWNKSGVDDRSVKRSLDSLSRSKRVAIFSDSVRHLSRYTRITAAASVTTTPSLVLVSRKGQAEVISGYVDRQTLAQYVRNARQR
jgi:hypothetical protein